MALMSDLSAIADNGSISFVFRVTNEADDPVHMQFRSGQRFDVTVTPEEGGAKVWRASEGRHYTMAIGRLTLKRGESISFDEHWSDPQPGTYQATATLAAENAEASAETTFTVE